MSLYVANRCPRCGGACLRWAPDGETTCILCARPAEDVRPANVIDMRRDVEDMTSVIEREARAIARDAASGRRSWA